MAAGQGTLGPELLHDIRTAAGARLMSGAVRVCMGEPCQSLQRVLGSGVGCSVELWCGVKMEAGAWLMSVAARTRFHEPRRGLLLHPRVSGGWDGDVQLGMARCRARPVRLMSGDDREHIHEYKPPPLATPMPTSQSAHWSIATKGCYV